jgi:hypothetical protein
VGGVDNDDDADDENGGDGNYVGGRGDEVCRWR